MTVPLKCLFLWPPLAILVVALVLLPHSAQGAGSKDAELAGAVLFRDKGCAYCHGAAGQGTTRGPSLANLRKSWKAPQIADQIVNGGQKMPSFKEALSDVEVSQLVQFLRAKHRPEPTPAPVSPPVSNPAQ